LWRKKPFDKGLGAVGYPIKYPSPKKVLTLLKGGEKQQ
jgi:hypothetical protein